MGVIGSIVIGMSVDSSKVAPGLASAESSLARSSSKIEAFGKTSQGVLDGIKGPKIDDAKMPGSDIGMQIGATLAATLATALPQAFGPLESISGRMAGQFDQLAGTLTTLSRRIDMVIRADFFERQLVRANVALKVLGTIGGVVATALTVKYAAAASAIAAAFLGIPAGMLFGKIMAAANTARVRIAAFFTQCGDVSKKSLSAINGVTFAPVIRSAGAMSKVFVTQVNQSIVGTTRSMKAFGSQALAALGVFGLGFMVVKFFKDGITGAVNLAETLSKTKEVFGDFTGAVTDQADMMAKKYGLVKGPLLDAASDLGLIAKAAGQTDAQAAAMSNTMVRLAADVSSFKNIPLEEALDKIKSGLVGESKPLRDIGVLMNEDATAAEAMRMGLVKSSKDIDDRAKIMARASLIERQLVTQEGDLERTSGGAANQFRKAGGGIENFATSMGTILLPAVTSIITGFNELTANIIEFVESNRPAIEGFANGIKSAFDGVGMVLRNFGAYWEIAGLSAQQSISNMLLGAQTIPANLAIIGEYIGNNWVKLIRDAAFAIGTVFMNLASNIRKFFETVWEFIKHPGDSHDFKFTPILEGFKATADKLPEFVKPAWVSLADEMGAKFDEIAAKEKKRADELAKIGPRGKRAMLPPGESETASDKLKDGPMFAGALDRGSAEARSAALKGGMGEERKSQLEKMIEAANEELAKADEGNRFLATIAMQITKLASGAAAPDTGFTF